MVRSHGKRKASALSRLRGCSAIGVELRDICEGTIAGAYAVKSERAEAFTRAYFAGKAVN